MPMTMGMACAWCNRHCMRMVMVFIVLVLVLMFVFELLMKMLVFVAFRYMEPYADPH